MDTLQRGEVLRKTYSETMSWAFFVCVNDSMQINKYYTKTDLYSVFKTPDQSYFQAASLTFKIAKKNFYGLVKHKMYGLDLNRLCIK